MSVTAYFFKYAATAFCFYIISQQIQGVEPMLVWCWASVADGGTTSIQHCFGALCLLEWLVSQHAGAIIRMDDVTANESRVLNEIVSPVLRQLCPANAGSSNGWLLKWAVTAIYLHTSVLSCLLQTQPWLLPIVWEIVQEIVHFLGKQDRKRCD